VILPTLMQLFFQNPVAFRIKAHHQRAAAGKGNLQFFTQRVKPRVAADGQFRFQTAGLVVIAGIDDGGIGPGDAGADIGFRFNQNGGDGVAPKIAGDKAP